MTTSRSISPSNYSIQEAVIPGEQPSTPALPDTAEQTTSAPAPPHSANRAAADRSSELRLRSATPASPLTLLELPNELLREKIDLLDIRCVVKLSETNQRFYQLTAPIRKDHANAHASIHRVEILEQHSDANPPALARADGTDIAPALISSPRFVEFNSILDVVNQMRHAEPKAIALRPLAEKLITLPPGAQRVNAFNDVSITADNLPVALRAQVLPTLARIVHELPEGASRLDAINGLLTAVHPLPPEHRVTTLFVLAGKLNALEEDQTRIDVASRIFAEAAQLSGSDKAMVLDQLANTLSHLPSFHWRITMHRAILNAAVELSPIERMPILVSLAKKIGALSEGQARTVALDGILDASADIPAQGKCDVLSLLAKNIRLFSDGQPRIDAFARILEATRPLPAEQKREVLLSLALNAHALPEVQSIDAFKRVLAEAATMNVQSLLIMLGKFLLDGTRFEQTPRQMLGELNELIDIAVALPAPQSGTLLRNLTHHPEYRLLDGGHSINAYSRILAATDRLHHTTSATVFQNMGTWIANLPEGQRSDAALKLLAKISNPLSAPMVLNVITDPHLFIQVLPKDRVVSVFTAMLDAVVGKLPSTAKEMPLTNMAKSIRWLPFSAKLVAFNSVAAATAVIVADQSRFNVLTEMYNLIHDIPEAFKADARDAIAVQISTLPRNFKDYFRIFRPDVYRR